MARVKFGLTVQEIRGKYEGVVFSKNGTSNYIRGNIKPVNPATDGQSVIRSNFGVGVEKWRSISSSDKALWGAYALNPPEIDYDPWGNQKYLSGYNWALRVWQRQSQVGEALQDAPGSDTPEVVPDITGFTYSILGGTAVLEYTDGEFPSGTYLIVECASKGVDTTQNAYSGFYLVWSGEVTTSTETDIYSGINSKIGKFVAGQFYKLRIYRQRGDGVRSPAVEITGYAS